MPFWTDPIIITATTLTGKVDQIVQKLGQLWPTTSTITATSVTATTFAFYNQRTIFIDSGQRSLSTDYANFSDHPMLVTVSVTGSGIAYKIDTPTTTLAEVYGQGGGAYVQIAAMIAPGETYALTSPSVNATSTYWTEYVL